MPNATVLVSAPSTAASTAASVGLLVLRVALGGVFIAHGAQKIFEDSLPATAEAFAGMGVPLAPVLGPAVAVLELAGGILLVLGLLTRPIALLLAATMVVALVLVHLPAGFWAADGGYEYVAVLAAGGVALALTGAGRLSADHAFLRGRTARWLA
ncbi:DoxX family protein [Microbacterium plantarum]|uniref:DoxX family protein n=1 Tax=Microbacterium plantarum TaxID=1816425 RepID=A0ABV5EPT2_9MICO